jgi:lactate dehydrogenase-like 2-hydroxyacid dehydrogenase
MIYLTDYVADPDIERAILSDKLAVFSDGAVDRKSVEVLLIWHFAVDESVLLEYPNLKAVVRYGVGVDNVDLEACHKRGIKVFNNPDYGVDEVSDTAVAMIMALSRNIIAYDKVARNLAT